MKYIALALTTLGMLAAGCVLYLHKAADVMYSGVGYGLLIVACLQSGCLIAAVWKKEV